MRLAAETFNTAILIHPDNFNADNDEVEELIEEQQYLDAIEKIDELLEDEPERPDLRLRRADVLNMLGSESEALEQYEETVDSFAEFLEANIKLGTQYLRMGHHEFAARQFNRAIEINERIVDAYIGLAIAKKMNNNIAEAFSTLSLASSIQSNSLLLFAHTAALQFTICRNNDLCSDCDVNSQELMGHIIAAHQRQIAVQPGNPDLYHRLGLLLMYGKSLDSAATALLNALAINPTFSRARNKLAICLLEMGQKDSAMENLIGPDCLEQRIARIALQDSFTLL